MKLQFRQIEPFLKNPDKAARMILVYGPDSGLVRERAAQLGKHVVPDLNDPFNVAHLTGSVLEEDPARLSDEARAQSLMGGMRLVRVTDPSDKIEAALKDYLKNNPNPEAVIIIEAGDLKPASKLRKLAESAANAAALPCYVEEARDLAPLVRDSLKTAGILIDSDALTWFTTNVKGDRQRVRMETEKLIIYMGDEQKVTLQHVQDCCGEAGAQSYDDLVYAVSGKDRFTTITALRKMMDEGVETTVILRVLQNHFYRLHSVKTLVDLHKTPLDQAMGALQPPVFFKQADAFKAQLRAWSLPDLHKMIAALADAEAKTRQTGVPAQTVIAQILIKAA